MDDQEGRIEGLWNQAAARIAQEPERGGRDRIREEYVREAVRLLEDPDHGGYVVEDLSALTHPADRVERQYVKKAFKRLWDRGEIEQVGPFGEGMIYRLA